MGGVPRAAQEEKIHKEAEVNNVARKRREGRPGGSGASFSAAGPGEQRGGIT